MTDELRLPCHESDSPDDWFIRSDGRQYPDDDLLDPAERQEILEVSGEAAANRAEADAKRTALARRRHAKEACHTSCRVRLECLDLSLQNREIHGTWGGYYEEERHQIQRKRDQRGLRLID